MIEEGERGWGDREERLREGKVENDWGEMGNGEGQLNEKEMLGF